jgi:RNA polymerase sigma-70 factor, ECF subfamily
VEQRAFVMARLSAGNGDDALDIVQDAMLDFTRSYSRRPEEEWKPLFYRVLQSRITDWYRRTAVRNRFRVWFNRPGAGEDEEDPLARVADSASPDAGEMLLRREAAGAVATALRSLPLRQRQAFVLRIWEELDVAQSAVAMGCSEGSVKTHLFRAMQALRKQLKDYGP